MQDEITLREVLLMLRRQRKALVGLPLGAVLLAAVYAFLIADKEYTSQATLSLSGERIQAQLEERIQLQQNNLLPFEAVRAIAFSEEVVGGVWQALDREGLLPPAWRDSDVAQGFERMVRYFDIKEATRRGTNSDNQVLIVQMSVRAPSPALASRTANLWAEEVVGVINRVPYRWMDGSLAYLQRSLQEAQEKYQAAQARWLEVSRKSSLSADKIELEQLVQERVRLGQSIASLRADLAGTRARLRAYQEALQSQRVQLASSAPPEQIALINRSFEAARESLRQETERLRRSFEQAAMEQEAFRRRERIAELQLQLDRFAARLGEIAVRLGSIATEKASKQAELRELESLMAREPRLLEVMREVVVDPVVAMAVGQGNWPALESLRLRVQEVNPAYQTLFAQVVSLRAGLEGLESSERALREEAAQVQRRLDAARSLLASQLRERERLGLEFAARKAAYEALRQRYEQLSQLSSQEVSFDSPNPEYLRLRSAFWEAEAEQAAQQSRLLQLEKRLAWVDGRVAFLRGRVAQAQLEQENAEQALGVSKDVYLALVQKKTDLEIQAAASQNTAQLLVRAYPVYQETSPRRALILLAALAVGLLLGLIYALVAEALQVAPARPSPTGQG